MSFDEGITWNGWPDPFTKHFNKKTAGFTFMEGESECIQSRSRPRSFFVVLVSCSVVDDQPRGIDGVTCLSLFPI